MSKTATIYVRVEPEIKEQAEILLENLGISMSNAISMFLRQIVMQRGIPFELKMPINKPLNLNDLTKEQLNAELEKGVRSMKEGKVLSADEVEAAMRKKFGI